MSSPGAWYFTLKEERVILMKNGIRPIQGESTLVKLKSIMLDAGHCSCTWVYGLS